MHDCRGTEGNERFDGIIMTKEEKALIKVLLKSSDRKTKVIWDNINPRAKFEMHEKGLLSGELLIKLGKVYPHIAEACRAIRG